MTLTQREEISLSIKPGEVAMKNASHYRALASLYRQQAAYNPARKWHLLGQAERWEHLAAQELASHFKACNTTGSSDLVKLGTTPDGNDKRWKTIVAA
jgi:hypothetical protein